MSTVPVTEQTITAALRRLPAKRWQQVLAYIDSLQPAPAPANQVASDRRWTATELRKLPPDQRDAILARQAAALADEYRNP
jgi:DNA-directed RNA polymerase specialized sigma24 family protein